MKFFICCFATAASCLATTLAGAQTMTAPIAPAVPGFPAAPPVVPGGPLRSLPPNQWTAVQIRKSFDLADSDGNGALTRAEAQHLAIMPRDFEDMDENKDGFVTRAEYEASFLAR